MSHLIIALERLKALRRKIKKFPENSNEYIRIKKQIRILEDRIKIKKEV